MNLLTQRSGRRFAFVMASGLFTAFSNAQTSDPGVGALAQSILDFRRAAEDHRSGLEEELRSVDPVDRRKIREVYADIEDFYLKRPLQDHANASKKVVFDYVNSVSASYDSWLKDVETTSDSLPEQDKALFLTAKTQMQSCVEGHLPQFKAAPAKLSRELNTATADLTKPSSVDFSAREASLNPSIIGKLVACCTAQQQSRSAWSRNNLASKLNCEELERKLKAPDVNSAREKYEQFNFALSPPTQIPDPIKDNGLSPSLIAEMDRKTLSRARYSRGNKPLDESAMSESEYYDDLEISCRKGKKEAQSKSKPGSGDLGQNLAKAFKCHLLPALGTYLLDTEYQRITTGIADVPYESDDYNLNCNPAETAAYIAMRPTDPAIIDQQWGISQMGNPPYIQNMRMLAPLQSPFPIVPMPNGALRTPFGEIGGTTAAALNANGVVSTGQGLASRRASSRGKSSRGSRGLAQGRQLTQATRGLSSQISSGRKTADAVGTLKSGASNTRALAATMVKNNSMLSASERRGLGKKSAESARSSVRALAGSRASRTTSENMLGSLRGRAPGSGTKGNPPVGSIVDIKKTTEKERKRLQALAQGYVDNMELAKAKGNEVLKKIQELVFERDKKSSGLLTEILNKPPRKQAKKVTEMRKELMEFDKQIGQLKAEYDVYGSSMLEQASLLQTLASFGTQAPNFPGFGTNVDPRKLPPGFPNVGPPGSRGRGAFFNFLKFIDPIQSAFASALGSLGIFQNEQEWSVAWSKFLVDYEDYVGRKSADATKAYKNAATSYGKYRADIDEKSVRDFDTETLITMDMYSETLLAESTDLLKDAESGTLNLGSDELSGLRKVKDDSSQTQELLDQLSLQYKDSYPLATDENPEIWWAMLPEMLVY